MLGVAVDHLIGHRKIIVRRNGPFLGHQVAHMAVAGQDFKVLAEVFFDGFRLGWRLDDNEMLAHVGVSP